MASFRVMAWRGIPTQVQASDDSGKPVNVQLPPFFQQEIDRVAMREGLIDSDEYLDGWAWSDGERRDASAEEVAEAVAAQLVEQWKGSGNLRQPR
ncbi:MAG: virulence factor [Chloroflexota bacterium]